MGKDRSYPTLSPEPGTSQAHSRFTCAELSEKGVTIHYPWDPVIPII